MVSSLPQISRPDREGGLVPEVFHRTVSGGLLCHRNSPRPADMHAAPRCKVDGSRKHRTGGCGSGELAAVGSRVVMTTTDVTVPTARSFGGDCGVFGGQIKAMRLFHALRASSPGASAARAVSAAGVEMWPSPRASFSTHACERLRSQGSDRPHMAPGVSANVSRCCVACVIFRPLRFLHSVQLRKNYFSCEPPKLKT